MGVLDPCNAIKAASTAGSNSETFLSLDVNFLLWRLLTAGLRCRGYSDLLHDGFNDLLRRRLVEECRRQFNGLKLLRSNLYSFIGLLFRFRLMFGHRWHR